MGLVASRAQSNQQWHGATGQDSDIGDRHWMQQRHDIKRGTWTGVDWFASFRLAR